MQRSNACSAKILLMIELTSSRTSAMGSPERARILISKGYRAFETLNSLQKEPQRTDLNMRCELINRPPRPIFICCVGTCRFISMQSALIVWHHAFKGQAKLPFEVLTATCSSLYFWPLDSAFNRVLFHDINYQKSIVKNIIWKMAVYLSHTLHKYKKTIG